MTDIDEEEIVTLDDFTGATEDPGGQPIEAYISDEPPDHDPFTDYPDAPVEDPAEQAPALFGIPMAASVSLAHNLDVRRQKIWGCWGKGVAVGWIADASHQQRCSDHNKDAAGVVHAIDPMVTGARAQAIVNQCLAHNADLQYVIHNGAIWSVTTGWKSRKYNGSNQHRDHVHISGKHGSSNKSAATCTGYDLNAQKATPVFDICPKPKPKPPAVAHKPGSRELIVQPTIMSGADVVFVQKFIGKAKAGAPDGKYGPKTASGVRWYQDMRDIPVNGHVDRRTWAQMGVKWNG